MTEVPGQLLGFEGTLSSLKRQQELWDTGWIYLGLCWPGLGTATDLCEIVAPSARVPLSAPEPHRDSRSQLMVSVIPFPISPIFPFLHSLIWQFVCTCKNIFNLQSFQILFPSLGAAWQPVWLGWTVHGTGRRAVGARESICPGARQSLSSCLCLASCLFLWQVFFPVQTWMYLVGDITSQSWQLSCMYFFSLACYFICVFQSLFCGMASILPSWIKARFIPRCLFHLVILHGKAGIARLGMQAKKRHNLFVVSERLMQLLRRWRLDHSKMSEEGTPSS